MDKHADTIINGIFVLAGVVLGFLLQLVSNFISEKKGIKEEFSVIKNVIYTASTIYLCSELSKLRLFFIKHDSFLSKPENSQFFQKWLTNPLVEDADKVAGYWTTDRTKEMYRDLEKTRL